MNKCKAALGLALGLLASGSLQAGWTLDGEASSLFYVTSKAAAVSEVNSFAELSGAISDSGQATLVVGLASVDTGIDIRNQRMREIVFDTASYPAASVSVDIDTAVLEALAPGESRSGLYSASVDVHGTETELSAELLVSRQADGALRVQTLRPLLVPASQFGFADAVEELRGIAGLPSINPNVVVTFSLLYQPDQR